MEGILSAHAALEQKGNLSKTLTDVQTLINQLQSARDAVAESPELTAMHMAKLKQPVKASFDRIEEDLKEVNKGLNHYQKALKDKFKTAQLPAGEGGGVLSKENAWVNRAIAMHFLREGKFDVASTFVREVNADENVEVGGNAWAEDMWTREFGRTQEPLKFGEDVDAMDEDSRDQMKASNFESRLGDGRSALQKRFTEMYFILDALRNRHDLTPAIAWARENSTELENRGSNLEFELARLKFIQQYTSPPDPDSDFSGPLWALSYARNIFPTFSTRYSREISTLLGSLAFSTSLDSSPYTHFFTSDANYDSVSTTFTREFCGMLGLASSSPLYTAVTAGGISLPILEKVERVMAQSRGQWTSVNELPVETPLPPGMQYHSIFVCPVSKEQATDENPPMMLPCGHVIAKESLEMHARGKSRMKCPYCPGESHPREAKRVYI